MNDNDNTIPQTLRRQPWNKGKLIGPSRPSDRNTCG